MIPLAIVWYTLPPETKNGNDYISRKEWNLGVLTIINRFIVEARERNFYAKNILEYSFNFNEDVEYEKKIQSHPNMKKFIDNLEYYIFGETNKLMCYFDDEIIFEFNENFEENVFKYIDGLYENEIFFINEPYKK